MEELKVGTKTYQYCALSNFKNSLLWLLHLPVFTVSYSYRFCLSQNYSFSFSTYIKIQHPQQLTKIFVHLSNILLFTLCLESTTPHSLTAASKETDRLFWGPSGPPWDPSFSWCFLHTMYNKSEPKAKNIELHVIVTTYSCLE